MSISNAAWVISLIKGANDRPVPPCICSGFRDLGVSAFIIYSQEMGVSWNGGVVSFIIYSQGFSMSGFSNFQGFRASGFSVVQGFSVSGFSVVQGLTVLNLLPFKRTRSSVDTAKCWTKKGSGYKV
jgi:hypothetical protein